MISTGITREICVSYREIGYESIGKLNTFFQNDDVVKSPDKFIEIIPPQINKDLRTEVKLCLNRMKLEGYTDYVLKTQINDLERHEFVFMVVDMFQNSEMMLLADEVLSYVGYPEKKIVFDRMYEDVYHPLYGYNGTILAKLRTYYWVDNSDKPVGVINNMYIDTKNGDNVDSIYGVSLDRFMLMNGYKTHSTLHDDLLRTLNEGLPKRLVSKYITNKYGYTYPCHNVHIINVPFPPYITKLRRERRPTGVPDIGIPIGIDGTERFDVICEDINTDDHIGVLDIKIFL